MCDEGAAALVAAPYFCEMQRNRNELRYKSYGNHASRSNRRCDVDPLTGMKIYLICSLAVGAAALIAAGVLLFAPRRTERRLTAAAILGGLAAFSAMFALCLGYFMV